MKRDLRLDAQQVTLGDSSRLTLELSQETPAEIIRHEFETNSAKATKGTAVQLNNPFKHIYLIFDNLSNDETVLFSYEIQTSQSNKLELIHQQTESTRGSNDLFRNIVLLDQPFDLPDELDTLRVSWSIQTWDTPGTYAIYAYLDNNSTLKDWPQQVKNSKAFPQERLKVTENSVEPINISMREAKREDTPDQLLWVLIRNRTLDFNRYRGFIDKVMCTQETSRETVKNTRDYITDRLMAFNRSASYGMLKAATEFYLMQEIGLVPSADLTDLLNNTGNLNKPLSASRSAAQEDGRRTGRTNLAGLSLSKLRDEYLENLEGEGGRALPYFKLIRQKLAELPLKSMTDVNGSAFDACYGILQSKLLNPPLMELIWSYWHEEGGLVQTLNALSLRFQNVRRGLDRDPLANLAIDPLRPMSNLLWGYIEDERNRLTINRRNLEYQYEYGISLIGKAIQDIPVAEHRTNFLRGFHELLRATVEFYQQANFTTVIPDGFPILNHLREVHLLLAEGAHNQYGDLPWVSRIEMLTQQWLLARPEVREFLGGRIMVPYTEPWMDRVDNMKQLQGWNPTNITHFRDLGAFGEQLLLSIRYGSWNDPTLGGQNAANWAHYWRAEIQRYMHAYKAVTGIDLASDIVDARVSMPANEDRYQQPSQLIERQVAMRQNGQMRPRAVGGLAATGQLPQPNGQQMANGQLPAGGQRVANGTGVRRGE